MRIPPQQAKTAANGAEHPASVSARRSDGAGTSHAAWRGHRTGDRAPAPGPVGDRWGRRLGGLTPDLYQPPLMLTHEEWVNRGRYESLFARRRPPTRRAIPTARWAVRVGLSGGWYYSRFRATDLITPRGRPDASPISRSWASITALAGSSPSRPPSTDPSTLRLEGTLPSA